MVAEISIMCVCGGTASRAMSCDVVWFLGDR